MPFQLLRAQKGRQRELRIGEKSADGIVLARVDEPHNLTVVGGDRITDAVPVVEGRLRPQPAHLGGHSPAAKAVHGRLKFAAKVVVQCLVGGVQPANLLQARLVHRRPVGGVSGV